MNLKESKTSNDTHDQSRVHVRFWSSTEYSGFLAGLIRELTDAGLPAEQCFQISEASYRLAKSTPARLFLRFRQYVAYPVQLITALGRQRIQFISSRLFCFRFFQRKTREQETGKLGADDVCVVSTNTFYAPLLATYLHPNVVHLVYDLFPEAMIHSGKWTEGTLKVRIVRWIVKQTLRRSKCNVFLGQRLKDYVDSIHGQVPNAEVIPVGADQSLFKDAHKQRLKSRGSGVQSAGEVSIKPTVSILYCGNFGNMHDSETLLEYWAKGNYPDLLEFKFYCSGPKRALLAVAISELPEVLREQIFLGDGLAQKEWIQTMAAADLALVTMSPGAETVVMPSKTYSAMMAGQAILAIAPENSDLVDLIKETDCGWWVEPGDVVGLEQTIREIIESPTTLRQRQAKAIQFAHENFGQEQLAKKWISLFEALRTKTD